MIDNNVHCLNCHKADTDLLAYLEDLLGKKKIFFGFIEGNILGLQLSADIGFTDGLVIAETIKDMTR